MSVYSSGIENALEMAKIDANRKPRRPRRPRWKAPTEKEIKDLRNSLGLTQSQFAEQYGLDLTSLRKWEQGQGSPEQVTCLYLKMIEKSPEIVTELVSDLQNNRVDS